jgi:cytidine deaminase
VSDEVLEALVESARAARDRAYAPYSRFRVGAAVMTDTGKIFVGCNVENATYGATLCAERSAIAQMVSAGENRIVALAVFTDADEPAAPCGICRQVIAEFARDAEIILATPGRTRRTTLDVLFPDRFTVPPV